MLLSSTSKSPPAYQTSQSPSPNLQPFIQQYTITRLTNTPTRYSPIFATDSSAAYPSTNGLFGLLEEVCRAAQDKKKGKNGSEGKKNGGTPRKYYEESQSKSISSTGVKNIPEQKSEVKYDKEQQVADQEIKIKSNGPNPNSTAPIGMGKLNYGNYFATGKTRLQTGCCVFGGNNTISKK